MDVETPEALLRRLKLGREETFQRLLTSLILRAPYPRWNTRSTPDALGYRFLDRLMKTTVGGPWPGDNGVFVDELELAGRSDNEKGGAPDWAVLWPDRVWIIELKTEKGSHRPDQVATYFDLAHHHFPGGAVDLTYLTGPMSFDHRPAVEGDRYSHIEWADVAPMISDTWATPKSSSEASLVAGVLHGIEHLDLKPADWRSLVLAERAPAAEQLEDAAASEPVTVPALDVMAAGLDIARLTAADSKQRALDHRTSGLEELLDLRLALRDLLAADQDGGLRHVRPWIWRIESTGEPLTTAGSETGRELRFSYYDNPLS